MNGMPTFVVPFTVGRMGNFLFQAAATIGYARRHNLQFTMPSKPYPPRGDPVYLQHLVHPRFDPMMPSMTIKEQVFHYHDIEFREEWRDGRTIMLEGYWQSEKYFKDIRNEILALFAFEWSLSPGMVSVHVRRTDYLKWKKKHPRVPKAWIQTAMGQFSNDHVFIFFSDDMEYCKTAFGNRGDVMFSEGQDEVEDLRRMSCCEHHICSASTFSWWAAWLNRNPGKRIIMPKLWFVPGWGGHDTKDIVPPEWERL